MFVVVAVCSLLMHMHIIMIVYYKREKKVIVVTYKRFFSSLLSVRNIKNAVTTTVEASFE